MKEKKSMLLFVLICVVYEILAIADVLHYGWDANMRVIVTLVAVALIIHENKKLKQRINMAYINGEEDVSVGQKRFKYFFLFGALGLATMIMDIIISAYVTKDIIIGVFCIPVLYVLYITSKKNIHTTSFLLLIITQGLSGGTIISALGFEAEGAAFFYAPFLLFYIIQGIVIRSKDKKKAQKDVALDLFGIEEDK